MRQVTLQRHPVDALTLQKPEAVTLTLQKRGGVSIILQLVGDRPATGAASGRITRTLLPASRALMASQSSFSLISRNLTPATRSLSASQYLTAQIVRTLSPPTRAANAGQFQTAQIARTLAPVTRSAEGYQPTVATVTRTLEAATRALVASNTSSAFVVRNLNPATRTAAANQYLTASMARTLLAATRALVGTQTVIGTIGRTVGSAARSIAGTQYISAVVSRTIASPTRSLAGSQYLSASIARTIASATGSASAGQKLTATISRTASPVTRSLAASQVTTLTGLISRTLATAARSLVGNAATLPVSMAFTAGTYSDGGIGRTLATMPGWSYSRSGASAYAMTAAGVPTLFAVNVARITDQGLLIEPAATNLVRYSTDGVNAMSPYVPSIQFMNITTGQADPAGGTGAVLFAGDGTNNTHGGKWRFDTDMSYVSGTTYVFRAEVKAGGATLLQLTGPSGPFGTSQYANFTLTGSGTINVQAGGTATITKTAYGYILTFAVTATSSGSDHSGAICLLTSTSQTRNPVTGSSGSFTVWGWQVEAGSVATSLIVTAAGSAARGADVCSLAYAPAASTISVVHASGTATPSPSSPLNLGSSSAGAWVGKYIQSVAIAA